MIHVLEHVSLECTKDGSLKRYHVQLVARAGGFQCLAQYGRIGRVPKLTEKTPPGVSYAQAQAAFESITAEKRAEYDDVDPQIPEDADPYRDNPWALTTPAESEAIIAAARDRARTLDDPDHAERIDAARAESTERISADRAARAHRQEELSVLRDRDRLSGLQKIANHILSLKKFYPFIPELTTFVTLTKNGAAITVAIDGETTADLKPRMIRVAREIGGSFKIVAMVIANHLCLVAVPPKLPTVRCEVLHLPEVVFTPARCAAIIRYVVEHEEYAVLGFYDPAKDRRVDVSRTDLIETLPLLTPLLEGSAA